nr:hypothetical protein [Tanacetum cinerariifolium]
MVNAASAPVNAAGPNPTNSTNNFNIASPFDTAVSLNFGIARKSSCCRLMIHLIGRSSEANTSFIDPSKYPDDPDMLELEDIVYSDDEEDVNEEADLSNLETNISVSPIPTTRVQKDHHVTQIISDLTSAPQTRSMARMVKEQDLPKCKRAIGLKWVFGNKKDKRGIVIRNKARLVAQGDTQEEGMDYDEVFAPVARIKAIQLFLAYASFMGFMVYQMDVKSAFLYGTIEEEVYVCQPPGSEDPDYPSKVYKVVKALYGLHQAPRAWYKTLANYLWENGFQRGKIDQTLFIKKKKGDILLVRVYVDDIIFGSTNKELCKSFERLMKDKFQMNVKLASTPIEIDKPLLKDPDGEDVDVHIYRSMIGSLMYLTSSRPDIMFAVCTCARFQVTPKVSHLHAVKRIFRYLKGKPHLGLWYPKDSSFNLVAYSDSDYAGASLDRKSTTGGCQFLAAASCYAQIIWIQNQLLDYGHFITAVSYKLMLFGLTKDAAVHLMLLDDADGVEYLPNEEIFVELARMGYKKPPPKLTFYKAFFSAQWKFLIHTLVQCVNAKRTAWNEFSCYMASAIINLATEQDKHTQALEIINLKKRVKKLEKKKKSKSSGLKRLRKGRITQEDVSAATKDVNAAEPTVFDDEEVTMTMAQTLTKMKAEKARLLDEHMSQRLHDEEVEKAAAKEKQEKYDLERAQVLRQYLKRKPVSIALARKNMIIYLKNMAGYKMKHFRGMTYEKVRPIFEREYKKVQTLFKPEKDVEEPTKKRVTEETLLQESFKKLKAVEVSVSEFKAEALQVKYPLIDWEIYSKGSRSYWKIIRVGGITEAYQSFEDMLKGFDREDLVTLWRLVKEKFNSVVPSVDKEKTLWVELKRLFEQDAEDVMWKLQREGLSLVKWSHDPDAECKVIS